MNPPQQNRRYVPVRVDGLLYCFDNSAIRSVALSDDCELFDDELPGGIVGETSYDGDDIPVLRLRSLLETNTTPLPEREHLAIVATPQGHCGFLVDDVFRSRTFAEEHLQPLPTRACNPKYPFFDGVVRISDEDDGDTQTQIGALLLSHTGLLGMPTSSDSPKLTTPPIDGSALLSDVARRTGQLMMFDASHVSIDEKLVSFGFSVTEVLEITQARELLQVPLANAGFFGLLTWRNQFVPIIDLTKQLDLEPIPDESKQRIVIVRSSDNRLVGFYSNTEICTIRMPFEASPFDLPGISNQPIIDGCFATPEGQLLLIPSSQNLAGEYHSQTAV